MKLPDTNNINPQSARDGIRNEKFFIESYYKFKDLVNNLSSTESATSFYKFSDGEYAWLTNNQIGSVSPGKRDSNLKDRDLELFRTGVVKNDYLLCQALNEHLGWYKELFNQTPQFFVDYLYALVANKWFTENFNGRIGLIGAGPKLELIEQLCTKQEYLDYLKFDGFTDYIKMPQKFLCDNLEVGEQILAEELPKTKSSIFLVGIGHAQQVLLERMKKYKNATFISVGSGICAYAGVQDNLRPYMGDWVNFKLRDFDYTTVDIWRERFLNLIEI